MQGPVCIIANAGSGKKRAAEIETLLAPLIARLGEAPEVRLIHRGSELSEAARMARLQGFRTIIAAGGDGTVCAVAAELAGSDVTMGVLPMGTFNYFSRSLGFPQDPAAAIEALAAGEERRISVGEINGEMFLNNASLGLYSAILENREQLYGRLGRSRAAAYWSVLSTILSFRRPSRMRITIDGDSRVLRTPMVFVAANGYQLDQFNLPGNQHLAEGKFAVFTAPELTRWQLITLALRLAAGTARPGQDFHLSGGREVEVETRRRRRTIARDGERDRMAAPFRFRMRPGALRVLVPPAREAAPQEHVSNRIAGTDAA